MSSDVISAVRKHLIDSIGGPPPVSASVTFLGLEPLDVLRFGPDDAGVVRYATVGCSRHPMGDPSEMIADANRGPRAEIVLAVRGGTPEVATVKRSLAILAASPAVEGVVLVADGLLDLGQPLWDGAPFTAVLLGSDASIAPLPLPEPAEPVVFFDAVPITGTEAAWVRLRGAHALRDAWSEAGIDVRDPSRGAATL